MAKHGKRATLEPTQRRNLDAVMRGLTLMSSTLARALELPTTVKGHIKTDFVEILKREADFVARLRNEEVLHIEWQSTRDPIMGWRMLAYHGLIRTQVEPEKAIHQFVVYVGEAPSDWRECDVTVQGQAIPYPVLHLREMNARPFFRSGRLDDNMLGLLMPGGAEPDRLVSVVTRIRRMPGKDRDDALTKLGLVLELRSFGDAIPGEVMTMLDELDVDTKRNPVFRRVALKAQRETVEKVFRALDPNPPAEALDLLDRLRDETALDKALQAALGAKGGEDLLARLGEAGLVDAIPRPKP